MFVDFNILNQLGSPSINSNTFANRPAAGQTGRLFVSTDTYEIYRDNGTTWDLIGGPGSSTVTGTGAATQVAYWTAAQAIGGSNNLWWDNTNGFLGVGTAAPTTRIEAVKTDGIGIYANFTTNAGSGSSTTGIYSINNTASSGYAAVIEERTANTTGGQYPLLVKHSLSAGTAAIGMGTGLQFQLPDDAGTFKTTQLTIETIDAAAATYKTRYRFNVQNNGSSTPVAYINSTGVGVFTATPSAALDIHSTGIIAVLNSTGSTNNGYLAFQRAGTGVWRIGDTYNGGSNFFELHNTVLNTDALQVAAATNKTSWQATETYTTGLARGNYFDFNLSVSAGGSFSSPNAITALGASLDLTLAGNATIPSGARSGLDAYNTISFTGTGTLTHNQGTQIRAYSNVTAGWSFGGSATGTITHLAGLRALFPDNTGSAVNVTNNYALLLNDQTANTGTVTYTNRWGVYQEGASDLNYMAANLLLGSTTNTGNKLQVTGSSYFSANVGIGITPATAPLHVYGGGTVAKFGALGVTTYDNLIIQAFAGNTNIGTEGSTPLLFLTNSIERARIDTSGNLGLGVTPSAWSINPAFEIKDGGSLWALNNQNLWLSQNVYFAAGSSKYLASVPASQYVQSSGTHLWNIAPSGTAGNNIPFTQAMTLLANNNLLLGTTSDIGTRLHIAAGNGIQTFITGNLSNSQDVSLGIGVSATSGNSAYFGWWKSGTNTGYGFIESYAGASPIVLQRTSGNVLIGTTTDAGYKLDVNGNSYVSGESYAGNAFRVNKNTGSASLIFSNQIDTDFLITLSASSNPTKFALIQSTVSTRNLVFDGWNNIGIGTFAPSEKLEVNGAIKTAAPTTGTAAAWKLGSRVAATVVVNTTEYIEVDIGGTLYKLATVT